MAGKPIVHIEFATKNGAESAKFYLDLFGWDIQSMPEFDYWTWSSENGGPGGGFNNIGDIPQLGFEVKPGTVIAYVSSDDIETDLSRAEALGAKTVTPKMEIPTIGWFGIFQDASGNLVGLYTALPSPAAS